MKVLDASAWVQITTTGSSELIAHERLIVPGHFEAELLHSLRGVVRSGRLTREIGLEILQATKQARILRVPIAELVELAWPLAEAVSGYDALYVALAQREDVPLLTADAKLARGARGLCTVELLGA